MGLVAAPEPEITAPRLSPPGRAAGEDRPNTPGRVRKYGRTMPVRSPERRPAVTGVAPTGPVWRTLPGA